MGEGIHLPTAAGSLLALAGAMHVAVGVDALSSGASLLPALVVVWGAAALCGVAATAAGLVPRRVAYPGGIALVVVSLAGYVDVYALGATESALGIEWQPPGSAHDHGGASGGGHDHGWGRRAPDDSFADRLASGHFALPSKLVELAALGLLAVLLRRD